MMGLPQPIAGHVSGKETVDAAAEMNIGFKQSVQALHPQACSVNCSSRVSQQTQQVPWLRL